jgi:hypothetical protein
MLPEADGAWSAERMRGLSGRRDREFFAAVCRYGQWLWMAGKPAQALLQLNRALAVEPCFVPNAADLPYPAIVWILQHPGGGFLGNPVRHYQHLASRVNQPARELRSWRAWACFELASELLDPAGFPRDREQIASEKLVIPAWEETLAALEQIGAAGEARVLARLRGAAGRW